MRGIDKKGEISIALIIAIVVGAVVLIFLLFGFGTQGRSFMDVITNLGGGSANVDTIKTGCEVACAGQKGYAYCEQVRKVNYDDKTWQKGSCKTFSENSSSNIVIPYCDIDCGDYNVPTLGFSA